MKLSRIPWAFSWIVLLWVQFRVSDSAVCSSLVQQDCLSADGCYWADTYCSCASNVTMDVVFALDASGSIGAAAFDVALEWMKKVVTSAITRSSRVGIIEFATSSSKLLGLEASESYDTAELVDFIDDIPYTQGCTNTVKALDDSMNLFKNEGNSYAQYVLIIITDGNPCCSGCCSGCSTTMDVCSRASSLKAMGITVVLIGVGSGWTKAKMDCLVKDDTYVIPVSSYSETAFKNQVLPKLQTITCPVEYKLIITEVQPASVDSGTGSRFVEVYNPATAVRLSDLSISGVFTGTVTDNTLDTLQQTSYMVFYDNNAPDLPSCEDCGCAQTNNRCNDALYIQCCNSGCKCKFSSSVSMTDWSFTLTDTTNDLVVDSLTYDSNTWPSILTGYAYELKFIGFDNQEGANWQQSCNSRGTPGAEPIDSCSWTCTDQQCQLNGASSATCVNNGCTCNSNSYYVDGHSCVKVPPPGECIAYWLKQANTTNVDEWDFIWDAAKTDRNHTYRLTYYTDKNGLDTVLTSSRIKTVSDYAKTRGGLSDTLAGWVQTEISGSLSSSVDCYPVTMSPTASPTFHPPVVYIGGDICSEERCSCHSSEDSFNYTCTGPAIEKNFAADNVNTHLVTIRKYPRIYSHNIHVFWNIWFLNDYEPISTTEQPPQAKANLNVKSRDEIQIENQRKFFESKGFKGFTPMSHMRIGRKLVATFSTTDFPDMVTTHLMNTEITPAKGVITINDTDPENKIEFIIFKQASDPNRAQYRLYMLNITNCTNEGSQLCTPVYPSQLFMIVDTTGGDSITTNKTQKETPTWLWWMIGALVLFAAILGLLGYRYWWKNKQSTEELKETNAELNAAQEENELGFGRDLAIGDVQFNPIATGVPNTTVAPHLNPGGDRMGLMQHDAKADVAVEKFKHREEFGQKLPDKRGARPPPPPIR